MPYAAFQILDQINIFFEFQERNINFPIRKTKAYILLLTFTLLLPNVEREYQLEKYNDLKDDVP